MEMDIHNKEVTIVNKRGQKPKMPQDSEKSRRRSELWNLFEPLNKNVATCNLCMTKLSYRSSISNLKKHLKRKHPMVTFSPPDTDTVDWDDDSKVSATETIIIEEVEMSDVPQDHDKHSPAPKTRKRSELWKVFEPLNENYARCNLCRLKFSYKSSTSNLRKHLQKKHPFPTADPLDEFSDDSEDRMDDQKDSKMRIIEIKIPSTSENIQSPRHGPTQIESGTCKTQQVTSTTSSQTGMTTFLTSKYSANYNDKVHKKLLFFIIMDLQPFSIVQEPGFKEFVSALNPKYQLPDKHFLSKTLMPAIYEECWTYTKNLVDTGKAFCITTDAWTSISNIRYVGITAHFLDQNFNLNSIFLECFASDGHNDAEALAANLERVAGEWGIQNKIIFATVDNDANVQKAVQEIGWENMGCISYTINLIVQEGLKNEQIIQIIEKIQSIVSHFKVDDVSNDALLRCQESLGKDDVLNLVLELILEVPNRWKSTFYMLERFLQLEEAIKNTIDIITKQLPILSATEWNIIKELCQVLKHFEDATKSLGGKQYCTSALVIPICNGLRNIFGILSEKQFVPAVKNVVQCFYSGLQEQLGDVEENEMLSMSTFLDPRFKQMAFDNPAKAETVKKKLTKVIADKIAKETYEDQKVGIKNVLDENCDDEVSIWAAFDKSIASAQPNETSRAKIEIQRYLEEEIISRKCDPLLWWQDHKQLFPYLSEIAQEKLCTSATSVPSERLFSTVEPEITERRSRLSDKKVQMVMFLNANMKYVEDSP